MRAIWFVAGTAAGVYATARARRAVEALSVDGLHDRLTGWFAGARVLRDEVRAGAAEKETQLRSRLVAGPDDDRAAASRRHHELTESTGTSGAPADGKGDH